MYSCREVFNKDVPCVGYYMQLCSGQGGGVTPPGGGSTHGGVL